MQKFEVDKKTVVLLAFYVFLVIDLVIIVPLQIKKLTSLHSQFLRMQRRIRQYEEDKHLKDTFAARKEKIIFSIEQLKNKIVDSSDIITLSTYISTKAKENAVELEEILPDRMEPYKTTSEGKFYYLPLRIKAKAGFHNLAQFINVLEEGFYFLEVRELEVKENTPYHKVKLVVVAIVKE